MISFWPFHKGTGRVMDLEASQLSGAALKSFQQVGRAGVSMRLLYRTLELDPYHPQALLLLIELFHGHQKGTRPKGDEIFSGILVEYAADNKSPLRGDKKQTFDKTRLDIMTAWGFVSPRAGETDVDHLGYMAFINEQMRQYHSVANGFKIALNKVGVQAGVVDPVKGSQTRAYQEWLHSDASTLHF
jgi:hypothetical protein